LNMNKIAVMAVVVMLFTLPGCIKKEEKHPSFFKTDNIRMGDRITYEVMGKMIVEREGGGYLIYYSSGEESIEIKKARVKDGFGNQIDVVDFYTYLKETPYNYTVEKKEDLPVNIEKHIYRLLKNNGIGGIVKSITIHHAINRDRNIEINSMPMNDIIDFFLEKEFNETMSSTFYYQGMKFEWKASYDKHAHALRIDVESDTNATFALWIKNGYPLPYKISFSTDDGTRYNEYKYILRKFERGNGEILHFEDIPYNSTRNVEFHTWKDSGAPWNGEGGKFSMNIQVAMIQAGNYEGLKNFLANYPHAHMVYAEYWKSKNEDGWILHFGDKNTKEDYVLNVSSTGRAPIPSKEISPYLAYPEIPKDVDEISDTMLSVADAQKIFEERTELQGNYTFAISFIEDYYPDTPFDIWEGNLKEKEISLPPTGARGACTIYGLKGLVYDYSFGYRLLKLLPPFILFDGKLNGENGLLTYVYSESLG